LVGKATTDTLTNKTLTAPTITGAGAIAGVFTGNITGNVTGNADTVTTNADLTGPVTSTGNATAIASGAITTAMQKHLQTFEFNGYISSAASTNYFIPTTYKLIWNRPI
jgi:trimeric autotransporter adhesin